MINDTILKLSFTFKKHRSLMGMNFDDMICTLEECEKYSEPNQGPENAAG